VRHTLIACLLLFSMTARAQPPEEQRPQPAEGSTERPATAKEDRREPAPAPTFTPSEKIQADSAVSFPVDI
jgi:hypothetical protein